VAFLQKSGRSVTSCRVTWNHPNTKLKITLYPMMHIASREFYESVGFGLQRCTYVLTEGVSWRKDKSRRKLYDLAAKNLGLVAQEDVLRYPAGVTSVHIDMPTSEFRSHFVRMPLRYRLLMRFLRPLLRLLTTVPDLRNELLLHLVEADSHGYRRKRNTPMHELIHDKRDEAIVKNIEAFYREHGIHESTAYVAIVFGAAHMVAVSRCLRKLGFRPKTRRWLEILRVTVGTDGKVSPSPAST
jgi:hypothetical protein